MQLNGRRFLVIKENPQRTFDAERVKALSGADTIAMRSGESRDEQAGPSGMTE